MHKLSHLVDGEWQEHSHPVHYQFKDFADGTRCLIAGSPSGEFAPFELLALRQAPPYYLLYVLHTPRGEAEPGRYMTPALTTAELSGFIARFATLLTSDSRFDLWAISSVEKATVVWDHHNLLHAYGPLDEFVSQLNALGYTPGPVDVPVPHQHYLWSQIDVLATALLSAYKWQYSELRPEDEQFQTEDNPETRRSPS
jgi:hypothetical protein